MGIENFSRIKIIRTLSPKFQTKTGLGVSSEYAQLKAQFDLEKVGSIKEGPGKIYTLYSNLNQGIGFEVDSERICQGVVIFTKDYGSMHSYLPIYPNLKRISD